MTNEDKKIAVYQLSRKIGRAIAAWIESEGIEEPFSIRAVATNPSCYIDDKGEAHNGWQVAVYFDFLECDDDEEGD